MGRRCANCLGTPILGEQMVMNYRAARLDARQRAMLDFAVKLTERPWEVEEADRATLRQVGLSERDIWDVSAVTAFFNMSNRVAAATDMRPNEAYHAQNRTPRESAPAPAPQATSTSTQASGTEKPTPAKAGVKRKASVTRK